MRKMLACALSCILVAGFWLTAAGQTGIQQTQVVKPAIAFGLDDGTPVKLRLMRNLTSADARIGEMVDFEVLEDVKVNGIVVIARGGLAIATVTVAQAKRRMGRGGKLDVNIDYVKLVNGEKVALRAVKGGQGGGHVGVMTTAIVATSLVFFPAAPLFLFMKGKDITIPKGTELTAYINGTAELDQAKFVLADPSKPAAPGILVQTAGVPTVKFTLESNPVGADILIDGVSFGKTPNTIPLTREKHKITLSMAGFQTWEREVSVIEGTLNLRLDRVQ